MNGFLRTLGLPSHWPHFSLIALPQASAHFSDCAAAFQRAFRFRRRAVQKESLRQSGFAMQISGTLTAIVTVALGWFGNPFHGAGEVAQRANVHH